MNNFYPKELTSVAGSEVTIIYKLVICQAFSITKQGVTNLFDNFYHCKLHCTVSPRNASYLKNKFAPTTSYLKAL